MLRVLKQRTHFDLQLPEYCLDSGSLEEDRSDASYRSSFYLHEPVMSLDANTANNTDASSSNDNSLYPGCNSESNFYLTPPSSAPALESDSPQYSAGSPPQSNRLRHTEQAIYHKILQEATGESGERSSEEPDENKASDTEAAACEKPEDNVIKQKVMTIHSQLQERLSDSTDSVAPSGDFESTMHSATSELQETGQRSPSPVAGHDARDSPQKEAPVAEAGTVAGTSVGQQAVVSPGPETQVPSVGGPDMSEDSPALQIAEDKCSGDHEDDQLQSYARESQTEQPNTLSRGATPCSTAGSPGVASYRGISSPGDATSESLSPVTRSSVPSSPLDSIMSSPLPRGPPPLLIAPQLPEDAPEMSFPSVGAVSTPTKVSGPLYGLPATPDGAVCEGSTGVDNRELFYCHLCTYVGMSKDQFRAHMNGHFEHACSFCDYSSRTEGRLKRHIKDFHSDTPPETFAGTKTLKQNGTGSRQKVFRCRQCNFVAEDKLSFWEHSRVHINREKCLQCPKCPFVTEYKHHLEYHLRNHFGSKPFKCEKCNYACVNKSMLNSHMKSHTNVYQYRCADCTYATKYCHSLKLHLKKYEHRPSTVLNTDGSLPTDGSGDFELVSKRGPPRGPRGPKKDTVSPPAGSVAALAHNPMNGAVFNPNFWPLNGLQPPPPLIPVSGMSPLALSSMPPQEASDKVSGTLPGGQHPNDQQQQQQQQQQSSSSTTQSSHMPLRCNFCPFVAESYSVLSQHMLKVHATENQDLLNVFGIPSDALAEKYVKPTVPQPEVTSDAIYHTPAKQQIPDMAQTWAALHQLSNSAASIAASSGSVVQALKPNTSTEACRALAKEALSNASKPTMSVRELHSEPKQRTGDQASHPLDLTKPRAGDLLGCLTRQAPVAAPIDFSPAVKRPHQERDYDAMEANEEECSPPPSGTSSPTPRKRSRKGKAYKLDTLCMKLQERYTGSPQPAFEEGNDELSDYSMGKDSDAVPDSGRNSAEPTTNGHDAAGCSESVDYGEVHNSLSTLNSSLGEQRYQQLQMENSSEASDSRRIARKIEFGQGRNSSNGETSKTGDGHATTEGQDGKSGRSSMEGSYECQHCDIAFRDCVMYTVHMGYHGYQDPFKCNMCGQQLANKVEFFLHIGRVAHE